MRDDRAWLLDILEALLNNYIQVAGEAANQLSDSIRNQHPDIPWKGIIGMRNVLVHQYFGLDLCEIWDTVTDDLPFLTIKIQQLLDEINIEH